VNVALQICFDDPKESIETLAHVDGFSMKIEWDRRVDCEHRLRDLFEYFSERVGTVSGMQIVIPDESLISIPEGAGSEVCTRRKAEGAGVGFASLRFQR